MIPFARSGLSQEIMMTSGDVDPLTSSCVTAEGAVDIIITIVAAQRYIIIFYYIFIELY